MWIGRPGELRSIGRGGSPSWSGDGSRFAFVRRGWITVRRASGGASRRVVRGTAPAFSPDGRSIAFVDGRHRIEVISSAGGKARPVGRVRGLAVDWQPLPAHPASCVPPPRANVIAQSGETVVTSETGPPTADGYVFPATAVMGCLTANGRERVLESSLSNNIDGATDYPMAALGGTYAGVFAHNYDEHYPGESNTVDVFDLRTGARWRIGRLRPNQHADVLRD
jgi:WD40-like Beta Propeller Repeat